jgi:CDP-diacylglycerol---glycerol-3-phosphate 3-phosphatidyltransferase
MAEAERPSTAAAQAPATQSVRPAPPARLTSLPNMLGVARIAATPVVMALLLYPFAGAGLLAFLVFGAAALTDFIDGKLARARGEVSPLGVFLDLTADKVLVAGALIAMVEVSLVSTWIAALLLIRELVIQGVRQLAASADVVMPARTLGKGKTFATLLGMGLLMLAYDATTGGPLASAGLDDWLTTAGVATLLVATVLSLVSGLGYIRAALPLLLGRELGDPT